MDKSRKVRVFRMAPIYDRRTQMCKWAHAGSGAGASAGSQDGSPAPLRIRASACSSFCSMKIFLMFGVMLGPVFAQSAGAMLAQVGGVRWERQYTGAPGCIEHVPVQMDIYATTEWTEHCATTRGGIIRESFYYAFGEPARAALLRVDLRLSDESPKVSADVFASLSALLTRRFGPPDHAPELMEIGFRHLRAGQPVSGDHWKGGFLHYFLHTNQSAATPMGVRRGVQLIVMTDRLMSERLTDDLILRAGAGGAIPEGAGEDPIALLRAAEHAGSRDRGAMDLLAADRLISEYSARAVESRETATLRRQLASHGVKLGGMTHQGGLAYEHDLLWRVWRDFADTDAGEMAFVELQSRGWNTQSGEGCPANPDLFREVIAKGEAFLAARAQSPYRVQVTYAVAVAYESWWSIGRAPADDPIVSAPPYPRRRANAREGAPARERAIDYYRQVIRMAPNSPEAASANRRLPRLLLNLDTGQRRFFCSYC